MTAGESLVVEDVTKTFRRRGGGRTLANDRVSATFRQGEVVGLLGHNGAGKTTLLNQVVGSMRSDSGVIRYGRRVISTDPGAARRVSSIMPQVYAPLTGVTPVQAITAVARLRGLRRADLSQAVEDVIDALALSPWATVRGEKLSGGARRLTSYAMAAVGPAPVLLVDEPTNDVDPARRPMVWDHLRKKADEGRAVVVVTHNLLEIERVADRLLVLERGQVVFDGASLDMRDTTTVVLTLELSDQAAGAALPPARSVRSQGGRLVLELDPGQAVGATAWLADLISQGEVRDYAMTPVTIESIYGAGTGKDGEGTAREPV